MKFQTTSESSVKKHDIFFKFTIALTLVALTACGESDLKQIQLDAIAEAREGSMQPSDFPASDPTGMIDATTPAEASIAGSTLIFSDEFNGNAINSTRWSTKAQWGADVIVNSEEQYYVDTQSNPQIGVDPFVFSGSTVSITAQQTPQNSAELANNQDYVSGILTTYQKFQFTYGYAEIRAKLPAGQGYWPGFWMLGSENVDLKPQVFVMENRGNIGDKVYHRYNYENAAGEFTNSDFLASTGTDFNNEFHTFGVEWDADSLKFFVDGVNQHTIAHSSISKQSMYLILSLAVGGWFPESPDSTTVFPGSFELDYVRVYQKN